MVGAEDGHLGRFRRERQKGQSDSRWGVHHEHRHASHLDLPDLVCCVSHGVFLVIPGLCRVPHECVAIWLQLWLSFLLRGLQWQ